MTLDLTAIRAAYPALRDGYAYLDGAAGTQVPESVIEAVASAYRGGIGNQGGAFPASERSDAIVAAARAAVADLVGGDPQTPVLRARPGQPFRTHILLPTGGSRGSTFQLDGHIWPLGAFQAEKSDAGGYPLAPSGIGSVRFGYNPMSMYVGAQESVLPAAHFSFMFPSAGGANAVPGDYLFRDFTAFGIVGGLWGLLRVSDEPLPPPANP